MRNEVWDEVTLKLSEEMTKEEANIASTVTWERYTKVQTLLLHRGVREAIIYCVARKKHGRWRVAMLMVGAVYHVIHACCPSWLGLHWYFQRTFDRRE